jgi:tRNA(Ile)-lysidine synthase
MSKKTLQDYMVDEKIEKRLRDHTFVLAEEHHVLWVIGHRISEYYKLDDTSSWILEIEIISE